MKTDIDTLPWIMQPQTQSRFTKIVGEQAVKQIQLEAQNQEQYLSY
jgi:hypothetical protein